MVVKIKNEHDMNLYQSQAVTVLSGGIVSHHIHNMKL